VVAPAPVQVVGAPRPVGGVSSPAAFAATMVPPQPVPQSFAQAPGTGPQSPYQMPPGAMGQSAPIAGQPPPTGQRATATQELRPVTPTTGVATPKSNVGRNVAIELGAVLL